MAAACDRWGWFRWRRAEVPLAEAGPADRWGTVTTRTPIAGGRHRRGRTRGCGDGTLPARIASRGEPGAIPGIGETRWRTPRDGSRCGRSPLSGDPGIHRDPDWPRPRSGRAAASDLAVRRRVAMRCSARGQVSHQLLDGCGDDGRLIDKSAALHWVLGQPGEHARKRGSHCIEAGNHEQPEDVEHLISG
jgi:hypothetical protein